MGQENSSGSHLHLGRENGSGSCLHMGQENSSGSRLYTGQENSPRLHLGWENSSGSCVHTGQKNSSGPCLHLGWENSSGSCLHTGQENSPCLHPGWEASPHVCAWARRIFAGSVCHLVPSCLRLSSQTDIPCSLAGRLLGAMVIVPRIAGTRRSSSVDRFYLGHKYLAPVWEAVSLVRRVVYPEPVWLGYFAGYFPLEFGCQNSSLNT